MNCIYCLNISNNTKGIAHVFPEAIFKNSVTLPLGSVCDGCNNYLKSLDSALIAHNHIWPLLQMMGLPGKKGKPRKKLGFMERSEKDRSISLNLPQKSIEKISFAENQVYVYSNSPQDFNENLFRRSLHHVAFNALAFMTGHETVMKNIFDNARKYIRKPKKGEVWHYVQNFPCHRYDPVDAQIISNAPGLIIRIGIFHNDFYIDLMNTGDLHDWATAINLNNNVILK